MNYTMQVNSLSLPIFGGYPFIFFKLVNQFNPLARELIFGRCAFAAFENTLTRLLNRLCRILFLHRHRPFQNSVCNTACLILLQNRGDGHKTDGWWHQLHRNFTSAHACGCAAQCCVGVQRGSIVSVCAAAYELPTLGVDGSRSLKGYEIMAHPPTRYIQNVSVALYCTGGLPSGFLFQGAASGPRQRKETGKGLSCFSLRGPVRHGIVTMEEMSLISRRRFMYSSTHT